MLIKVLITCAIIGLFIWWFLKENTRRGHLTIRAYLFLTALEAGRSVSEANHAASISMDQATPTIFDNTMQYLAANYRSKQMPMIKHARKKGMNY